MTKTKAKAAPTAWPADKVERWPIDDLRAYERNSRKHSAEQIDKIEASIREWGFTTPILVQEDGTIIAGHARVMAAKQIGLDEVPVMVARGWSMDQVRAYVIADNALGDMSEFDEDMLRLELGDLNEGGYEIELIGLDAGVLDKLLKAPEPADEPAPTSSLAERFGIPPFTVLRAAEGWWQDRKRAWLALGIESEVGRGENLLKMSDTMLEPDPAKRAAKSKAVA